MNTPEQANLFSEVLGELIEKTGVDDFFIVVPFQGKDDTEFGFISAVNASSIHGSTRLIQACSKTCVQKLMQSHGLSLSPAAGAMKGIVEETEMDLHEELTEKTQAMMDTGAEA